MRKSILAGFIAVLGAACTDEGASAHALRSQGMNNIQFTGYEFFACGEGDYFHTGFEATNASGQRVSGVVCCGWMKNCTVRW